MVPWHDPSAFPPHSTAFSNPHTRTQVHSASKHHRCSTPSKPITNQQPSSTSMGERKTHALRRRLVSKPSLRASRLLPETPHIANTRSRGGYLLIATAREALLNSSVTVINLRQKQNSRHPPKPSIRTSRQSKTAPPTNSCDRTYKEWWEPVQPPPHPGSTNSTVKLISICHQL